MLTSPPVISTNIYREADRPAYHYGNRVLLGLNVTSMFVIAGVKTYYAWRNKQRQRKWDAMSADEKQRYLDEHQDETGAGRLDFRFVT